MSSLTVPRGLGLVAALAVSGTALYLVYGYKKRPFLNIRRGKGSLRLEYRTLQPSKKESGISVEPPQRITRLQPLLLLPAPSREGEVLREKLAKCSADAALVNSLHTTLTSYKIGDQLHERVEESFKRVTKLDTGSAESSCTGKYKSELESDSPRDSLVPVSSSGHPREVCSSVALSSTPSSSKCALVGCLVISSERTSRKTEVKPKKVVRFSPSVAEPSSNNHDYRQRFKAEIAQRAACNRKTHLQNSETVRSIVYDRPRLHSQAAKHTITYNVHRGCRSYYSGNF